MDTKMKPEDWHFRPNTQDEFVYNEVYVENCYRLPDDLTGKVVIDIGANIGAFTIACLDRGAKVFAYEPDSDNFGQLFRHVNNHPLRKNCWKFACAVVGNGSPQDVYLSNEYPVLNGIRLTGGKSISTVSTEKGIPVSGVRIKQVVDMALSGSQDNVWLKIDCEGGEYDIILSYLPWNRIERIFGECHDYFDGKVSRDTEPVHLDLDGIEPNRETLRKRLESVGYQVEIVPHEVDPHLSLFFAVQKGVWVDVTTFADLPDSKKLFVSKEKLPVKIGDVCFFCGKPALCFSGNTNSLVCSDHFEISNGSQAIEEWSHLEDNPKQKTVCILTPFRNARRYLPLYFSQMASLQSLLNSHGYRMRIVAAEGDSLDGTRERLVDLAKEHNIDLTLVDTTHGLMRWASVEDPVRLKTMSDVMNKALDQVKESDDIVVWIMSDLKWEPEDILNLIQTAEHDETGTQDIYAPMVLTESGHFYDTWGFRSNGQRFDPLFPSNLAVDITGFWEIDSAGTCLVMKAETALECRAYKEEAVSFCLDARLKRHRVWLDIDVKVYHAPLPSHRLLWISDAVCLSGFSRVAHALFPQLVEAGYDLDIIALNYFGEPHNFPYTIYPAQVVADDPSGNLRAKYLIYKAFKEDRPYDLIIKLDDPWNVKGLVRALESLESEYQVPSPPVLAWVTVDGKNIKGEELLVPSIDSVISTTEFGLAEIIRNKLDISLAAKIVPGIFSPKLSVVPFGVDTSIFHPLDKAECRSLVSSQDIPIDAFIVGVVSTNQLRKRLDLILSYFSSWINQYQVSNAYLYLCLGPDDSTGFDINSLKDYYGLKNRIIWNPHLLSDQALALVYNSFDTYLSLSQGEGFGLPALEAMACGVPCVLSDWSAYSSWVPDSAAYKIPCTTTAVNSPSNVQSYVIGGVADQEETIGALQKLYLYPKLREKMGKAGVEFAQGMGWKETGDRLIKEIEKVISRAETQAPSPSPMMAQAEMEGIR